MPVSSRKRGSRFLLDLNCLDGLDYQGRIVARTGQVGTFDRGGTTGAASTIDANSRPFVPGYKTPRFYHVAGALKGLLLEPQRKNWIIYASDLTNAAWTKRGTCAAAQNLTGPDGIANSATTLSGIDTGTNDCYQYATIAAADGTRTEPCVWLYKITATGTLSLLNPQNSANGNWSINLASLSSGWNRITRSHSAVTVVAEFTILSNTTGVHFRALSGAPLSVGVWCAQDEGTTTVLSSQSIPTTSSTVTRSADSLSFAHNAVPQAQTWYAKFVDLGVGGGTQVIAGIGDAGLNSPYFALLTDGAGGYYVTHYGAANRSTTAVGAASAGATIEVCGALSADGSITCRVSINGAAELTNTNAIANALQSAWSGTTLALHSYNAGASAAHFGAYQIVRIALGVQSLAFMRAA